MKLRPLLYLIIILNVVYAQHNQKKYEIVDKFLLEIPYNLLWSAKTSTDAGNIRLAGIKSSPSDTLQVSFINPKTKKTISINSSNGINSLSKSNPKYHINKPDFNSETKAIIQSSRSEDVIQKYIYNAEGALVGDYTMSPKEYSVNSASGFPDGRLLRHNASTNYYEMMISNSAPPIQLTNKFDRPAFQGDKWYGMRIYYNESNQDIFVRTGVIDNDSMAALVFLVDKENNVLWERLVSTPHGTAPHLLYSPSGKLFTLIQNKGHQLVDLMVVNRSGQTVLELQDIRWSRGHQMISSDDKYLITIVDGIELVVYDLSDGQLVEQSKGGG